MSVLDHEPTEFPSPEDGVGVTVEEPAALPAESPPSPSEDLSTTPASRSPRTRSFGLATGDQLVIGSLAMLVLILMVWHWAHMSGWGTRPIEVDRMESRVLDYQIDINSASRIEFEQLDGIGSKLADRIIADRTANGPFESVDDLERVNGIGPKTMEKLRKYLVAKPKGGRARR